MRFHVLAAFILGCVVSPALQAQNAAPKKITTVEGITEYRLDNGLRVLILPDASKPTVTVNLTVLVGSRHEGYGETGMAHLLEHMVFKGTPAHQDVPKSLRDHGATFNGTTNYDRTNYFETMPATDENLEFGIRLEADRLVNSYIRREDLVSEMTVVRNEFERGENSPEAVLNQRMMAAAYEWHNYGKSTIGNRSDIERVPIENLQAFYKKFYQPDNCVLVLAGKFEEAKALELAAKYFGPLPKPSRKLDTTYTDEPAQDGDRIVVLRRVGSSAALGLAYHVVSASHPDFAACEVLSNIMSSEPAGRLYESLVVSKKASSVNGDAAGLHDPGVIEFGARCEPENLDLVKEAMIKEVESISSKPLTQEEVDHAKRKLIKNRELVMNDASRVASTLSNWAAKGDWRLFFLHRDRLEGVTVADVNRVAADFLKRSNRTVGLFIPTAKPERAEIAAAPPIDEMLKDYKGRTALASVESFDSTPQNIDAHTRIEDLGGIKAALLTHKTRGETVSLHLNLRYGNLDSLKGKTNAANMLGSMLMCGSKNHTRKEIEKEIDNLGARMRIGGDPGHLSVNINAKRSTLPTVLTLLEEILRSPTFPENEFELLKGRRREGMSRIKTDPQALAARALERKLSQYPPEDTRYVPTLDESLARLDTCTLDQVKEIYNQQLNGRNGELAVVGDFEVDPTIAQVRAILTNWDSKVPYKKITREGREVAGERIQILTPDKENAVYLAGLTFAQDDSNPEYAALQLGNVLLGGSTLSSRLGDRVRRKEGLSYGCTSSYTASSTEPLSRLVIVATFKPENLNRVDECITEEVNNFLDKGLTDEEVADGKKAFLERMKVMRTRDDTLANLLAENLQVGRNFSFYAEIDKKIADLTPKQILDAYRKHVAMGKLVVIHAGDFKKQ